jgi:hypothetical protein
MGRQPTYHGPRLLDCGSDDRCPGSTASSTASAHCLTRAATSARWKRSSGSTWSSTPCTRRTRRDAAEQSRDRLAFLAEVSRCLAESLDYETTLTTVAGMSLPYLGAWCIVDVVEHRRLFLNAPRVRDDRERPVHEVEHLEVADGHENSDCAKADVGVAQSLRGKRVHREHNWSFFSHVA